MSSGCLPALLCSALPSSAAGSLMMPSGAGRSYVSMCGYNRSSQDWRRMKRARRLKYDDGPSEPFLIARAAVTSADTRVDSSKVRVRLWITEEISSLFTLDHFILPIWCCWCRWWWWWWCCKRNLRDFPPVKGQLPAAAVPLITTSENRKDAGFAFVCYPPQKNLWASRHSIPIAEIR